MTLEIASFKLGPVATNTYLIADKNSGAAAVIDPAWDGHLILAEAQRYCDGSRHMAALHVPMRLCDDDWPRVRAHR